MADERTQPEPQEDVDPGEPLSELLELREPVSESFLGRVVSALRRRSLTSHLATLSWTVAGAAFIEVLRVFFSLLNPGRPNEGGSD